MLLEYCQVQEKFLDRSTPIATLVLAARHLMSGSNPNNAPSSSSNQDDRSDQVSLFLSAC